MEKQYKDMIEYSNHIRLSLAIKNHKFLLSRMMQIFNIIITNEIFLYHTNKFNSACKINVKYIKSRFF